MNEAKNTTKALAHTPGPWRSGANTPDNLYLGTPGHWIACDAADIARTVSQVNGEANARLMAAAPAMLQVLKDLIGASEVWNDWTSVGVFICDAEDVVAVATEVTS